MQTYRSERQYKKLCKKAALLIDVNNCSIEDGGLYHVWIYCGGDCDEWGLFLKLWDDL